VKAVRVHRAGGSEGLVYEDVPDPQPAAGQIVVRVEAIGVNYAEIGRRRNANPANLPGPMGGEGAGTVLQAGEGVTDLTAGDRVAFAGVTGAYAEQILLRAGQVVPVPANVTSKQAAAVMTQGMTAHALATEVYPLKPGDTCLVHAAAGGIGLLLCQIARLRGARVIGTVSTGAKAEAARAAGAQDTILYTQADFVQETKRLTEGRGVDVVYDSVGQTTFLKGFECIRPRGMMVSYGQSSGPIGPFDTDVLSRNGSLYLTRMGLAAYTAGRAELRRRASEVLEWVGAGQLRVHVCAELPLASASQAQDMLEARETIGKVLLIP